MKGKNSPFWSQWICCLLLLFLLLYFRWSDHLNNHSISYDEVLSTFRIISKSQRTCKWIYFNFEFGLKSTACKMWLSQEEQNRTEVTSEFYFLPGYCHYLTFLVAPWRHLRSSLFYPIQRSSCTTKVIHGSVPQIYVQWIFKLCLKQ